VKQKQIIIGDGTKTKVIYNEEINAEKLIIKSPVKFTAPVYADHVVFDHVYSDGFFFKSASFHCKQLNLMGVIEAEQGFDTPDLTILKD
jgi:hypothetical protein